LVGIHATILQVFEKKVTSAWFKAAFEQETFDSLLESPRGFVSDQLDLECTEVLHVEWKSTSLC
jgi:hypothetical protein